MPVCIPNCADYCLCNMNPTDFRKICGQFATGVTVLTTTSNDEVHGITVNSFTSVSLDPPLILFCIDKKARFNTPLTAEKSLAINILSEEQQEIVKIKLKNIFHYQKDKINQTLLYG